jgi:TP53 regulating kinase-like protein
MQISQGAEAKVWSTTFLGRKTIIKQRFNKMYRHPTLDALLTKQRLKAEVRCMIRARKMGVFTPVPYLTEMPAASIYMESIEGVVVKEVLSHPIYL